MPGKYTKSKRADQQIKQIYLDTAKQHGIAQADRYAEGLEQTLQLLADNPGLGRTCDAVKLGYQRHEYGRHIIFYRARKHDIFITAIVYDAMDLRRWL